MFLLVFVHMKYTLAEYLPIGPVFILTVLLMVDQLGIKYNQNRLIHEELSRFGYHYKFVSGGEILCPISFYSFLASAAIC